MKKYFFIILSALFVFMSSTLYAQRRNAAKNADLAFSRKQYTEAVDRYKKAYKRTKRNKSERTRISFQMGECYRLIGLAKRAEPYYKRVIKTDFPNTHPEVYLYLAETYKTNEKFKDAIECYENYIKMVPDDPRGPLGIETTNQIEAWIENPSRYEVTEMKKINSKNSDYAATWTNSNFNEIIFTSSRAGSTGGEKEGITGQDFADFWTSKQDRKGEWSTPVKADEGENINTDDSDGTPFMNSNYTKLYFTRCEAGAHRKNGCKIMVASKSGGAFSSAKPVEIATVDTLDIVGHPTLSGDELILYFSAERKGGFGGKDIWVATRKSANEAFGRPFNLGENINTAGDEVFPYLRNDTTLYFSSNGHGGMGGLDIFMATIDTAGNWGKPVNLKYPMNSTSDDFAICFHPTQERGFMSSNRGNGRGIDNIYYFEEPQIKFTFSGTVKDENTLQYVSNATVRFVGSDGSVMSTRTNDKGFFNFSDSQMNKNTTYEITIDKDNYFTLSATETTVGLEFSKDFEKEYELKPIPEEPIMLPDILYDLGKWDLKPQFEDSLQGLIETLQINPTITIELASHTDARDSDERNDILSQKRAQSVVDYLIIRGIDPLRLTAKGYGERVPRTIQKDITLKGYTFKAGTQLTEDYINKLPNNEVREAAHQMNRRTEFRILSKDFVPRTEINENATVDIAINPTEVNHVIFATDSRGYFTFDAHVDGYKELFTYSQNADFCISEKTALKLLNEGRINRDNFEGDVEKILGTGSVANNAIIVLKEVRIANKTLKNVQVKVVQKMVESWVIGQKTLKEMGNFEFDTKERKLIFK
ncbi:MAG: OmpA family protein [Bacteroidales bacterium]|jgi:peptidoglycan-associated lipoprotein|nr:OmpA family protein [Bacteroidales bacterium]